MKHEFFAIFNKTGFVRATKRRPDIGGREIAVRIETEIPDHAFDDGYLHASIKVPDDAFILPTVDARAAGVEQGDALHEGKAHA